MSARKIGADKQWRSASIVIKLLLLAVAVFLFMALSAAIRLWSANLNITELDWQSKIPIGSAWLFTNAFLSLVIANGITDGTKPILKTNGTVVFAILFAILSVPWLIWVVV